ncbi:MAG: tetratricopeptide repeat protein [Legionellales bacterium]|nr:tetratricopeptide repeat protein [Legionellales bacterium]
MIGSILGSSPKTINTHIDNIKRKIKATSKKEISSFIAKYKKITKLKQYFNKRYLDYQYEKSAKVISHTLSILNITCFYNVSPKLINNPETNSICKSFELLNIKMEESNSLQKMIDYCVSSNMQRLGLLLTNDIGEIEYFKKYMGNARNNIIFICFDKNNDAKLKDSSVLFYDVEKKKDFYHFIIKYLIKNYSEIDRINKELDVLGSIDIAISFETESGIDNHKDTDEQLPNNSLQKDISQNFWFLSISLAILMFGWYIYLQPIVNFSLFSANSKDIHGKANTILAYNLPSRNINFIGRENAISQIKNNLNKHSIGTVTQAIVGSGGIGKTQLLNEYAYRSIEDKEYDTVLCVNSSTSSNIDSSYSEFAKKLGIEVVNLDSVSIRKIVHEKLLGNYKRNKILFILDNVSQKKDIQIYLKNINNQFPVNVVKHVLISSRSQSWTDYSLELDEFTKEEAIAFVKQHLSNEKEQNIKKLIKLLSYYPLALGQAVGYIRQRSNISDYLELYNNKKRKYLDIIPEETEDYKQTLWSILTISLEKLSKEAKEILFISSYLASEDIKWKIFNFLPAEKRADAIKELREHSLITVSDDRSSFKIHALLQEALRLKIDKKSIWVNKAIKLANAAVKNLNTGKKEIWFNARKWLPHIKMLYLYMPDTLDTSSLLNKYGDVARHFGMFDLAHELFLNSMLIQQKIYKIHNHIKLVNILNKLASLNLKRSNYDYAENYYQRVLEIKKHHYKNNNHIELIDTLNNLGQVELKNGFGGYIQAKQFYKKALDIGESHYKNTPHAKIASILHGLGSVDFYFGYFDAAKQLFKKALEINEKYDANINSEKIAYILNAIAIIELYAGKYEKSRNILKKVFLITEKSDENVNESLSLISLQNLAILEWSVGNYQVAKQLFTEILDNLENYYQNPKHIKMAQVFQGLGLAEFCLGNYADSIKYFKKDIAIRKCFYKPYEHVSLGSSLLTMGMANELMGSYDIALQHIQRAYNILSAYYKDRINVVMAVDYTPAWEWPKIKKTNTIKAITYYESALKIIKLIFGSKYHVTARYHYLLGQAYEDNRQIKESRKQYEQALVIAKKVLISIKDNNVKKNHQKNITTLELKLSQI